MNGKAHMLIGGAVVVAVNYFHPFITSGWMQLAGAVGVGMLSALAPDIDHPTSTLSHKLGIARGDGLLGCSGCLGGVFRSALGGHRGITHTLLLLVVLALIVRYAMPADLTPIGVAFLLGYASHLVADLGHGVPLFWPLSSRHIKLWR
jgi:inner membrane protein